MLRNTPLSLAFHTALVTFVMAPLITVSLVAFTAESYLALPWSGLSLRWFRSVFADREFLASAWVSIQVAVFTATLGVALALPAVLAIGRYQFPGRDAVNALLLAPIPVPGIVLGVTFLRFMTQIGWNGTVAAMIVCHLIVTIPFVVRILLAAIVGLDKSIPQAAQSLGASRLAVFRRITLPMLASGISGAWIMAFLLSFDELTVAIFVASTSVKTLPVWLFEKISWGLDPSACAASVLIIAGTFLAMLILDRIYGLERLLVGKSAES
ncbi:ABC transporter permease [Boseaceae bacterium BT-24-1]|nr:ABC transporter permease [Boseaceae bacterium BT-24-1]